MEREILARNVILKAKYKEYENAQKEDFDSSYKRELNRLIKVIKRDLVS